MTKILVCQHVAHESLGTLEPLFKSQGLRIRYVNFGRHPLMEPHLEDYEGLVILGGPMNVDQTATHPNLLYELKLIEEGLKRQMPILGICLGAQLIARALGAHVTDNHEKEIGWHDVSLTEAGLKDPLFAQFQKTERLFHWHGQTFEIPSGAIHLASSQICTNQAFRYGDRVYGLQFHLEVDERSIHRWLTIHCNQDELQQLRGKVNPTTIRNETPERIVRLKELSDLAFSQFIQFFENRRKFVHPPSR